MNLLILGGTTEASVLARRLAGQPGVTPILSLAGRTRTPALPAIATRRGGFGGIPGLLHYLREAGIDLLLDATHPFAARMHLHATAAAAEAGIPRAKLLRPAWTERPGDRWTTVPDMPAAVAALGPVPRRVFLTVGQQELAPFVAAPWHHYLIRSVEPPDPASVPPGATCIAARGPFEPGAEARLLAEHRIEVVVTKNAGGTATEAKLEAARTLRIPVLLIARPPLPAPPLLPDVPAALAWLGAHGVALRGV